MNSHNAINDAVANAIGEIEAASKQFGEYTYHGKGAAEVMDVERIVEDWRSWANAEEIGTILRKLLEQKEDAEQFVIAALLDLQDHLDDAGWDALMWSGGEHVERLY